MAIHLLRAFLVLGLLALTGCMCDTPPDGEISWNHADERDGVMALPRSVRDRWSE